MASSTRKFFYCLSKRATKDNWTKCKLYSAQRDLRWRSAPFCCQSFLDSPLTTRQKQAHKYKHSLIGLSADTCRHSGPIPPANPVLSQPAHTPPAGQTSHVPPQPPFGLPVTKRLLHSKTEHVNDGSYHCHSTSDPNHSPLLLLHAVPILTPNSKIGSII